MSLFSDIFGLPDRSYHVCRCITKPGRMGCVACGIPPEPGAAFQRHEWVINTTNTTTATKPKRPKGHAMRPEEV